MPTKSELSVMLIKTRSQLRALEMAIEDLLDITSIGYIRKKASEIEVAHEQIKKENANRMGMRLSIGEDERVEKSHE